MLQHPVPSPFPDIYRDGESNEILVNSNGRTQLRFTPLRLEDPVRIVWDVEITHRRRQIAQFTALGRLPQAMVDAINACIRLGVVQAPHRVRLTKLLDGRYFCGCLDTHFAHEDPFAVARWMIELLITQRYLR